MVNVQSSADTSTGRTILVVEDEVTIREYVCEILHDEGMQTQAYETADQALEFLEKHADQVALLLTDIRMPGDLDGAKLSNLVAERWPRIPIIVMSAQTTPAKAEIKPDVLFVPKPWTVTTLLNTVSQALEASS